MRNLSIYRSYLKSPYKSIKHSTYFHSYEYFFKKFQGSNITFIEIGVLSGGSLFMWRDYFGKKARIIGVDLNENAKKWEKYGFEIFIGDQSDPNFWLNFRKKVGKIDIVLDDGGHTYEQQIITVESLIPSINDGGMILVEDTHTSYMKGFGPKRYSFLNYVKNKIDKINYRFSKLSHFNSEKRIWSIEIVESMVAFKINKIASKIYSEIVDNGGKDDNAKDSRYQKFKSLNFLYSLAEKYKFLSFIPFKRVFFKLLKIFLLKIKFKAKKYFD